MIIDLADVKDIPLVARLEREIFSEPWSKESLLATLKMRETIFLVARENDRVAGYAICYTASDEADITNVAVAEEFRRSNYGMNLVAHLIIRGGKRGVKRFYLEVRQSNEAAKKMYDKLGFTKLGIRKNYYDKPVEDAVLMGYVLRSAAKSEDEIDDDN